MPEPTTVPESESESPDETLAEEESAPLNRADRRARAKKPSAAGGTGPAADPTLRRGRGPRSHTKRV